MSRFLAIAGLLTDVELRRSGPSQRANSYEVEGHWFLASSSWESLVAPLIQR